MTQYGSHVPAVNRGLNVQGAKKLFFSKRDVALIFDKAVSPGWGLLPAGTLLCENVSAAATGYQGYLFPYPMTTPASANPSWTGGRIMCVADVPNGTACDVSMADSYRLKVGDDLILSHYSSATYMNGGAITAIDRTTYAAAGFARITFTTTTGGTGYTVATGACCWPKGGSSGQYAAAKYILDQDVDTGTGALAKGANVSVVLSHAILYKGSIINYDTQVLTDMSYLALDGQFVVVR